MSKRTSNPFPDLTAAHATQISVDAITADAGNKSTSWIMLFPKGKFSGRDGRGPYDASAHMAQIVEQTKKRAGITELVIDYDHQSVFSAVPGVGGVAPAAGWIKEYDVREDGLWARVDWTEKAAQAIKAGEYRYISPVYHHTKTGDVIRLVSAGLTNMPNLDLAAVAARANPTQQEENMDKIALALGLAQGASEDAILVSVNSVLASVSAIAVAAGLAAATKAEDVSPAVAVMRAGLDKMAIANGLAAGAKADDVVVAVQSAAGSQADPTKFVPVSALVSLQSDFNALKSKVDGDSAEIAVNSAMAEGKITPALKDWAVSLYKADAAQFHAFIGAAPVLTAVQRSSAVVPANGEPMLSESDLAVMNQLGLSREAFVKTMKGGDA